MQNFLNEIQLAEKQIESSYQDLRTFAFQLCDEVMKNGTGSDIVIAPSLKSAVEEALKDKNALVESLNNSKSDSTTLEDSKLQVGDLKKRLDEIEKKIRELKKTLGAIAFERSQAEDADQRLKELFKGEVEKYKTISSNIRIVKSDIDKYYSKGTLLEKVLSSYNIKSESKIDNTSLNGIYTTNNSIDGKRIFYFKGDNTLNNNVIFAGYCFKILRTDENMGIRLVYSGNYENNSCNFDKVLDVSSFNDNNNYNAYVGFMYGSASSNNYIDEHKNINSSKIKTFLDNWYINNLSKYSNIISDSYYCNNRKTSNFKYNSTLYGTSGYANNNTGYASFKGLSIDSAPTLKCYNVSDRFSINLKNGNNALNYPVGLLTADEVSIIGNNSYLNTNNDYWTMTPAYYNGAYSYNYIVSKGKLIPKNVSEKYAVRPVITLKSDVKYTSGDGSIKTPYIIK